MTTLDCISITHTNFMEVKRRATAKNYSFLNGGGESAGLIASMDWLHSSLGSIECWPQSLRTTLSIVLHSKFPMLLFWGADHICFYNDAFRQSLGTEGKHPQAMGSKGIDVWTETWHLTKPILDKILEGGESLLHEDQLIPIYRNGKLENVYWTYTYSPVEDEKSEVGGVLVICNETTERINLVDKLKTNEKKFFDMIEQAPIGFAIFMGEEFIIEVANKAYLEIVDRDSAEVMHKPMFEVMPEVEPAVRPLITNVLKTGVPYHGYEFPVQLNRHGQIATGFFNFTYQPLIENAEIKGVIVVANDITKIVEAKHALVKSEQVFRDYINAAPLPFAIYIGREMRVTIVNDALLRTWDKDRSVIGKTFREALPELEGQPFYQLLDDVYTSGKPYHTDEDRVDLMYNGKMQTFYFNFTYTPLKDENGNVYGVLNTATDITELVLAKRSLADAEERSRIAAEAGELGTFELNIETEEIHCSQRFNEIFGAKELVPRVQGIEMILPEDRHIRETAYRKAIDNKDGRLNYEVRIKWKDESIHWVRMDAKVFFDELHRPTRLLGTIKDITEQKNAVQKIEESEKHFRNLIQEAPLPKALLQGPEYIIEIANDAVLELWGKDNSIIGKPLKEALPEIIDQPYLQLLDNVYKSGITYRGNELAVFLPVKGELKKTYLNLIFKRLQSSKNKEPDILITGYDVTQQVLARRKIEESEKELYKINQRLEIALDAARLGSYELELATGIMNCTPQCKASFGLAPDDVFNFKDLLRVIAPIHKEYVLEEIEKALKEKINYNAEYQVTWPDNSLHWVRASGKVIYDEEGKPIKMIGVTLDITESKLAIHRIQESEQRLNMALEYTNTGSWDLNLQTFEIIYTPRLAEIFGYPSYAKLSHSQFRQHIHPDDAKSIVEKAFSKAINTGIYFYEARVVRPDSMVRWIRTQGRVIYDSDKIPVRMLGTIMDITEEKNEQQRKEDFMGIITHELNTPLTSLKAFAQFLYEKTAKSEDETTAGFLLKMVAQINKLNLLVQELLDVTRISNGKMKFKQEQFNLCELVLEVTEQMQITTNKSIIVENSLLNGSIIGDRDRTGQVLANLLTNAIKYSPEAQKVIVSIAGEADKVICSVTDFGIGIARENQKYVFDRFYRETETHAITFPGLGLGLYISSEIVKRQGGEIWVESEKGKGSKFSFSLPLNNHIDG